ncbi:endolytic transglycosylase MltG [Fretibacter rubidus]|uniref:endolytic transglycosylase MltG n=1 Tax=Fretibacter rubidus TaxID=570162 RepID=UPI00352A5C02
MSSKKTFSQSSKTAKRAPEKPAQNPNQSPVKKTSLFKRLIGLSFILIILAVIAVFAGLSYIKNSYEKPGPLAVDTAFTVPSGAGLSRLSSLLETGGFIENGTILRAKARFMDIGGDIKVGEYNIPAGASMAEIVNIISSGKTILYPVTAPEGLTTAQILRIIAASDHLSGDISLSPPEGSLLPETYMTPRGMSRDAVIRKMMSDQTALIKRLWEARQEGLPVKTKEEAIILASVVEKETGVGGERAEVAGVFTNRLRRGMRLQSDPTIIYGISKGEILTGRDGRQRGLRRSEIDRKTDWNTYQIDGLPKTAICNPGADALAAVLNPAKTNNLYFVADGTGGHVFSPTLAGHNANVAKWRKIERERRGR